MAESDRKGPTKGRGARTARLGRVAAGGAVRWAGGKVDRFGDEEKRRKRRGDRIVATVDSLVDQLSKMRGAAMKAGQVLSTIEFPGLDPEQTAHVQERLASLRDDVPPVDWKQMRKVLEEEWGEKPESVLAEIDPEPAAAASIGQVYRGRRHDGGEVAIKVQYPTIGRAVESDMRNLRLLAPLMRQLLPGLDVRDLLDELSERIIEECDYELESANHRRIARYWRDHPFIHVPAVDTELSRRRVLVTEWIDGAGFREVADMDEDIRDRYAEIVYRFFYGTVLNLDMALGDPHPGNYLLRPDGSVAFFDFGMVRKLPAQYMREEAKVISAIRESDGPTMLKRLQALGYLPTGDGEAGEDGEEHWDGELLLTYMREISWWWLDSETEPLRLAPEDLWRSTERLREEGLDEHFEQLRRMTLPPQALLIRRMEGLLFQTASTLRAAATWGALLHELTDDGEPVGELGQAHAAWHTRPTRGQTL